MTEDSGSVFFFDFETTEEKDKITDIGALLGPAEYHGKSLDKFREVLSGAEYICGHNIIAHDIPLLQSIGEVTEIDAKIPVDTHRFFFLKSLITGLYRSLFYLQNIKQMNQ